MKKSISYTILLLVLSNLVSAQTKIEAASYNLSAVLEEKNYEIRIIDITDESQHLFNPSTTKFEEFENEIIDDSNGFTFFNEKKIAFYYIGFYKKHDVVWDTYKTTFISNLPTDLKGTCSELQYVINMKNVASAYLGRKQQKEISLDERKAQVLTYYSNALETDCKQVSPADLTNLLELDIMPIPGTKIKDQEGKN